jgi:hypothetical protein
MSDLRNPLVKFPNMARITAPAAGSSPIPVPGLLDYLSDSDGFYAFQRGLHVFGSCIEPAYHSFKRWNNPSTWIGEYGGLADGLTFFAEDTFGDQFAWDGALFVRFEAETASRQPLGGSVEEFFGRILGNSEEELGLEVLNRWILAHGPVPEGVHLFPRTPLVLGGSLDPVDVVTIDPIENMRFKGSLVRQIADVPDGGQVELVVGKPS